MPINYRSISAHKKDGESVRIYAIKREMKISDLLTEIIQVYSEHNPEFKQFVDSCKLFDEGGK